jgi:hypothetical protein
MLYIPLTTFSLVFIILGSFGEEAQQVPYYEFFITLYLFSLRFKYSLKHSSQTLNPRSAFSMSNKVSNTCTKPNGYHKTLGKAEENKKILK